MNKRIKELAAKAAEYAEDSDGPFDEAYTAKFAELIVKECADICLAQRDPGNLNYKPSERFAEEIKLHFGVK